MPYRREDDMELHFGRRQRYNISVLGWPVPTDKGTKVPALQYAAEKKWSYITSLILETEGEECFDKQNVWGPWFLNAIIVNASDSRSDPDREFRILPLLLQTHLDWVAKAAECCPSLSEFLHPGSSGQCTEEEPLFPTQDHTLLAMYILRSWGLPRELGKRGKFKQILGEE